MLIATLVGVLCLLWGSTWLVIQEGLRDLPPWTSAAARFVVAFAVMAAIAPWLRRAEGGSAPPRWLALTVGTLNFALSYAIVYTTETVLPSGLVSVLWAVFPLMMAVSGHTVLGERLRPRQWGGLLLGLAGVVALLATDLGDFGPEALPAALLLFVSPLVSAIGQTVLKRYGGSVSSALLNRDAMGIGAVWLTLGALAFESEATVNWSRAAIGSVVWLAVGGTVLTFTLYFWLLRHAPATRLSVIAFLTPVVALFAGAVFAGERLTTWTVTGAAAVIVGVAMTTLRPPRLPGRTRTLRTSG